MNGSGRLTGDTFTGEVTSARVGPLVVSGGRVLIPNLHVHGTVGQMSAHVVGQMSDLLTLIDMKPLNYPTRFHINPQDTKGTASVDLLVKVPMLADVSVGQIGINVTGQASGLDIALSKSTRLQKGIVQFAVDNSKLHAAGDVFYSGQKITMDWTEIFETTSDITTHVSAKTVLDSEGRKKFGLGTNDILTGPVNVTAVLTGYRGSLRHADIALDMAPSTLALDIIGITKAAGVPESGNIAVDFTPSGILRNADISVTGASLTASGNAKFDAMGDLATLNLSSVKGPGNDFSLVLTHGPASSSLRCCRCAANP